MTWKVVMTLPNCWSRCAGRRRCRDRGHHDDAGAREDRGFLSSVFDSGLQSWCARRRDAFLTTLRSIPWLAIGELLVAAIMVIFVLANVLWLVQRRNDRHFQVLSARDWGRVWGTMLIIATGEHGDGDVLRVWKRFAVAAMWSGVVLIAKLTATAHHRRPSSACGRAFRARTIRLQGDRQRAGDRGRRLPDPARADLCQLEGCPETIRMPTRRAAGGVFDAPTSSTGQPNRGTA